jgi:DMSO/TMAO reductase YedYZ molybdopterin-dependent catalytic subunit
MNYRRRIAVAAVALLLGAGSFGAPSRAAADGSITIDGRVQKTEHLTASDLQALPPTSVSVSFVTGHGQETGTYTGALLWTLLDGASIVDQDPKAHLRHTILVTGSDGYAVALSVGEIDPKFEGKSVIVAYARDGKPLGAAEGLRLIVPGDSHGGRADRDVVQIEAK